MCVLKKCLNVFVLARTSVLHLGIGLFARKQIFWQICLSSTTRSTQLCVCDFTHNCILCTCCIRYFLFFFSSHFLLASFQYYVCNVSQVFRSLSSSLSLFSCINKFLKPIFFKVYLTVEWLSWFAATLPWQVMFFAVPLLKVGSFL